MMQPVGKAYKPWIIATLALLVLSLIVLAADVTAAFLYFSRQTPLWVTVVGVLAALGVVAGFAGFFLLMVVVATQAWRESRRVQVLPPQHPSHTAQ